MTNEEPSLMRQCCWVIHELHVLFGETKVETLEGEEAQAVHKPIVGVPSSMCAEWYW